MPVRAPAGGLTEILLSVNTPVPQQRGIWADLQNLTKCYAIRKPEVGEARNSQETLPTLSAACVEHQTGADIVGSAVRHVRRDAIDTFQSQHGGRVFSAPDSGVAPLGLETNSGVVCPQHIEAVWPKNVAFPFGRVRTGEKRVLSNFNQTGHPQEIGHIIAIVRPKGVHLVAKFQANRPNGSVCAGPAVKSEMPVRAPAGGLTEILLSVNTPVPQQRGICDDLQNLTKCYAIWKPEVGE